ncbi:G-protein coupled receptor 84-like [Paramacrobiotus metropolitanus]|uniref:G-protein coupled receptor 84-like n=1 Tax=Paramacrobiotus metropolitanus TaxID=2943436 RepID=UPI002446527D|nr:G-protein coupled receptor 84-like [Paramacrobiotus metropolitanus]
MDNTTVTFPNQSLNAVWNFAAVGRLSFGIVQVILNLGMLIVFMFRKDLRTSFTIYIIFLLIANLIYATCQYPLEVVRQLYPHWALSTSACVFYIYQCWIFCPVTMHMHVLITLNRIWAIAFPVSYRNRHSKRMAVLLCILMLLYLHLFVLPLVIIDAVWYKGNVAEKGCFLNGDVYRVYSIVAAIITQDLPVVFVVGAYPFLLCKQFKRKKGALKIVDVVSRAGATEMVNRNTSQLVIVTSKPPTQGKASRPFLVLTLLTISVFIFWTPDQTLWTVNSFMAINDQPGLRNATMVLFALQAVLDPILFILSLKSFRAVIRNSFSRLGWRRHNKVTDISASVEIDDDH